ncbi:MAG TPA: LuxR C-terminal-related transcriptional regulator [Propionibacteriaceae bacterium]|nr:LuxR C-terminal-related transcriptional regulator [Propionibacteriaceae bacterium]
MREVQVLRLVAAGKSNREIASALVISDRTVARLCKIQAATAVAQPTGIRLSARSASNGGRIRTGSFCDPSAAILLSWSRTRGLAKRWINAAVVRKHGCRQGEVTAGLFPERLDPGSALRVADRLIDCGVAANAAGVREQ